MSNNEEFILPIRNIPFDMGVKINSTIKEKIKDYLVYNQYAIVEDDNFLNNLSLDFLYAFAINENLRFYLYSFGIGVITIRDDRFEIKEKDKFANDYCQQRKDAHHSILREGTHKYSCIIEKIVSDLRKIVKSNSNEQPRPSSKNDFENRGFSYVFTFSVLRQMHGGPIEIEKFDDIRTKNLLIMLEPGIANKEDSLFVDTSQNYNPYNFDINRFDRPKDWMKATNQALYISWAAVICIVNSLDEADIFAIKRIEYMEIDLQAMWMYIYCLYTVLSQKKTSGKNIAAELQKLKFHINRKFSEFKSNNDSSIPKYILDIRNELINSSYIQKQFDKCSEYLNYLIEEKKAKEDERQHKYSAVSEVLLYMLAFLQIAPMIYHFIAGDYKSMSLSAIIITVILAAIGMIFIIKKE